MDVRGTARKEIEKFRSLGTLAVLNVLSVGSSLAALTGSVMFMLFKADGISSLTSACTTLVFGLVWAAILRDRRTVGNGKLRWGWLMSLPLAMGNAAAACALLIGCMGDFAIANFVKGALLGATFGAIVWLPSLVATLVAFGVPIAWAQKRADAGLAGEEQGELVIGGASAAIALIAAGLTFHPLLSPPLGHTSGWTTASLVLTSVLAALGLGAGALAGAFAFRRERVRRRFVNEVEAGAVPGYRIDESAQGKVLVRVTSMGSGYRVANFEELLVDLDEKGEARRARARA